MNLLIETMLDATMFDATRGPGKLRVWESGGGDVQAKRTLVSDTVNFSTSVIEPPEPMQ